MLQSQRSNGAYSLPLVNHFNQELSTEETNELLQILAVIHLDRLTPAGMDAAGSHIRTSLDRADFFDLCNYDPDVRDLSADDQFHIGQALAFFRKRRDLDLGIDRRRAALDGFAAAEISCELTNRCFRAWAQGRFQFRPVVERVLHAAQRKISSILKDAPSPSQIRARFGPGASTQVPKRIACLLNKLRHAPACSTNFSEDESLPWYVGTLPFWRDADLSEDSQVYGPGLPEAREVDLSVHLSRVEFAPKNAKTDRATCTEPALNGMFQLGVGEILADCLRTVGIDISDQTANQRAALLGSITGALATLDLTSASDTVALLLVQHLFPEDWFELFCRLRSAETLVDGKLVRLQKISSMGNGFTFPLETMIFWAIAQAVVEIYAPKDLGKTLVYGDDIVVATPAAVPLMSVLRDLGFMPNYEKSFWEGPKRESCGKDYVLGTDIRPVFVKDRLRGQDFFRLHNFYYLRGDFSTAKILEQCIHPSIRLRGPKGYGDGHLISDAYIARSVRRDRGWSGYTFETWGFSPNSFKKEQVSRLGTWKRKVRLVVRNGKLVRDTVRFFEYNSSEYFRVRRLATYVAYLREDFELGALSILERDDRLQLDREGLAIPSERRDDRDYFTVPGRGSVDRIKVYTFESPKVHLIH